MAEPLGLAASVIAVGGLAHTLLKLAGAMRTVIHDTRNNGEAIRRSIDHIHCDAEIINLAQKTLWRFCEKERESAGSELCPYIENNGIASFLRSDSEHLQHHVHTLRQRFLSLKTRWVLAIVVWRYFLKDEIEALKVQMSFIQGRLSLLMHCFQLDMATSRKDKDRDEMQVEKPLLPDGNKLADLD